MYSLSLQSADHIRRYTVCAVTPSGWEVRLEEDQELRRLDLYRDWHRVERALASFEREAVALTASGWHVAGDVSR